MTEICELHRALKEDEIDRVSWIRSEENPADAPTRSEYNKVLQKAMRTGKLTQKTEQWISKRHELSHTALRKHQIRACDNSKLPPIVNSHYQEQRLHCVHNNAKSFHINNTS